MNRPGPGENYYDKECNDKNQFADSSNMPKWLEEISKQVINSSDKQKYIQDEIKKNNSEKIESGSSSESNSAKFGRRSLVSQLYENAAIKPKNIILTKSDYMIPTLDFNQADLEKSWKSLDDFKQSHKGRLDSAKNFHEQKKDLNNEPYNNYILSPISSSENSENESASSNYSPSVFERKIPNRSRSEMSNYLPLYVYNNIKQITESNLPISTVQQVKSNSSENIFSSNQAPHNNYDKLFEKKLSDYQLKLDKENRLREEIISELLTENERITEKLKSDALSVHTKLYNTNSKYKRKTSDANKLRKNEEIFIIPELPKGQTLTIDILSTWGDKYYVGMNGIEIFDNLGQIVAAKKITAMPLDVNVLPECNDDPRVVSNLLDGINRTQDDMHIWLAPFEIGCSHIITILFEKFTTLAMIRIWNYNKSRIHSYRGVKDIVIYLDKIPIFKDEIAKACGGILGGIDAFGDTILFTTDDDILENISKNDSSFTYLTSNPASPSTSERPPTSTLLSNSRPLTRPTISKNSPTDQILLGANEIDLVLLSNWGHPTLIGLTGVEIIEGADSTININFNCMPDTQTRKLINGENITIDEENMWNIRYKGGTVTIRIRFENFSYISGLRIWNYNGSLETSYAGVRTLKVLLDRKPVRNPLNGSEIFLLRRAPGNLHYDYVQDLKFIEQFDDTTDNLVGDNESILNLSPLMPEGFVFQIIIFSTWGDQYYCGLNGIEAFNEYGKKILLEEQNICAYPESVNSLSLCGDIRTPDKLIDGINEDLSGSHSWLAPIIPKHLNRIYVVMDQPITISFIKLWNYSKTPKRGIKEFGILVDDLLIYNGTLEKYSCHNKSYYQTVLFTENEAFVEQECNTLIRNNAYSQDVLLMDGNFRTTTGGSLPEADPALRPFTSVSPFNRGFTSHSQ